MSESFTRRTFLSSAVGASLALGLKSTKAEPSPSQPVHTAKKNESLVWPIWNQTDEASLLSALNSGHWGRVDNLATKVREFEALYASKMKAKYCVATSSGTTALMTALGALNIGPGDEVVVSPYTFVATFNAITSNFALPVFADTDIESFQIDPKCIDKAITPETKLIIPVHIGGTPVNIDAIDAISKARSVPYLEDACQAPFAAWRDHPIGTYGVGGCFSFQSSKNLTAGEGGAVLTNNDEFANLCFDYHTPGATKKSISSGRGSNFRLTEFQAAILLAQMQRLDAQYKQRESNALYLRQMISQIGGITPSFLYPGTTHSAWHLFKFRYNSAEFSGLSRTRFVQALAKEKIIASYGYTDLPTSPHVVALASNPHYQKIYGKQAMTDWLSRIQCPVNVRLTQEAVWFPQYTLLKPRSEIERIAQVIAGIKKQSAQLAKA